MPINSRPSPISIEKTAEVFSAYRTFLKCAGISLKNLSIADFGCAKGIFLQELIGKNTCHGFDISENSIDYCKLTCQDRNAHFNVLDLNGGHPKAGDEYDLITLFDVIEHLNNFTHLKHIIKHNLKKGGHAVITTPNANSLMRILGAAEIFSGEVDPTHTMLFTPYTLDFFLRRSGLKKTCMFTPYIFYFRNDLITRKLLLGGQIFAIYSKNS